MANFIRHAILLLMKRGITTVSILVASGLLVGGIVAGNKYFGAKKNGCNCANGSNDAPASNCEAAIVETNQEVTLVIPSTAPSGSKWEADLGSIRSGNIYDAPQNYIAPGVDLVHLIDPAGNELMTVKFFIKEGTLPTNPNSPEIPDVNPSSEDIPVGAFQPASVSESASPGTPPATPDYISDAPEVLGNLPTTTVGESTGYIAPSVTDEVTVVLVSAQQVKKGKKCAYYPWPDTLNKNCTGEGRKQSIYGPVKRALGKWEPQTRTWVVSASISGKIGISAGATITSTFEQKKDTLYQFKDVYRCENGRWVFDHNEKCTQTRLLYQFLSPDYTKYFLNPPDGVPPGPGEGYYPNPSSCLPI